MNNATGCIDVLSCGVGFPDSPEALRLLETADVVFASRSLLALCPIPVRESRIIGATAREQADEALALCRAGHRVVVLASGDALYHGFGGTLSKMAERGDAICYHPGITAFQSLFHRLGLPWEGASLFSVHSGEALPLRSIAEAPLAVIYAGSRFPASAVAQAVVAFQPAFSGRAAVIAERLGSDGERLLSGTLAEMGAAACGPTSLLLLLPEQASGRPLPAPVLPLGLPEDDYDRENNLITASDVRAIILSRLRLPAWGVLWDIGAGSGSVGLEAAGLRPGLRVFGVERKAERGELVERNRRKLGVANYTLLCGDALALISREAGQTEGGNALKSSAGLPGGADSEPRTAGSPEWGNGLLLPSPDRIFVGGGGSPELLEACLERLHPGGLLVASAVTLESFHTLSAWRSERRTALSRLDMAHERAIAGTHHHLKQQNTIYLFVFQKTCLQA